MPEGPLKKKNAIAYHIFQTGKYVFDTCCDLFQSDLYDAFNVK